MKNSTRWILVGVGAGSLVGLTVAALYGTNTGRTRRARLRRMFRLRPSEAELERAYDDVVFEARSQMSH